MYPAAICFLPAWRQSATPAGPFFLVTRRWIEKIVPIETLTSMLAEPSSGSYSTTYLPAGLPDGTGTGSSSSSEAVTHTRPVCWMLWRTVSLAKRSSFCCRSPETFTAPAAPRMSVSPARRTWREMIFAARQRSYSRFDSSPVASGWSRSCSMMNRSIVMTSDPSTVAVRGEGDGAALVGPQNRDAVPRQPRQHLRRRMAVMVAPPHADHGLAGRELAQPGVGRRGARAVVPHLQQLHGPAPHVGRDRPPPRRQPAQMVRVAVRRHDQGEPARSVPPEKRDHHAAARVALGRPRPAVHHPPAPRRRAQRRGVALPDVQEMYGQTTTRVERRAAERRIDDGRPADERHHEAAAGPDQPRAAGRAPEPPRRGSDPRPEERGAPPRDHDHMAPGDRGGEPRDGVEQGEAEPRARGEEMGEGGGDPREREGPARRGDALAQSRDLIGHEHHGRPRRGAGNPSTHR